MNPYQVLGFERGCTQAQVKKAYHILALENHPDKVSLEERSRATQKMQQINDAYNSIVLNKPYRLNKPQKSEPRFSEQETIVIQTMLAVFVCQCAAWMVYCRCRRLYD